jgi:hypothetical protein
MVYREILASQQDGHDDCVYEDRAEDSFRIDRRTDAAPRFS